MKDGDQQPAKKAASDTREARLAAALRDNLRRRKAAVSAVSDPADDNSDAEAGNRAADGD